MDVLDGLTLHYAASVASTAELRLSNARVHD
jgi:hypothetical protein